MQPHPNRRSRTSVILEGMALAVLLYVIAANLSLFQNPGTSYRHGLMANLDMLGSLICISYYRLNPRIDKLGVLRFWGTALFGMGCQEAWFVVTHL